jgi:hypothetical protein
MSTDLVETSLEMLAQRVGDPAPLVYARLFADLPEAEPLFVADTTGAVRGEMLAVAFRCLLEPEGAYTANLIKAERANHDGWGVAPAEFARFLPILREVCREALGADWTTAMDAAWAQRLARLEALT